MVHRYREIRATGGDLDAGLGETSKAVLVASLTTAFGFGSLALSGFAGLRSVGWLSVFGAVGSGLAALTLLPALLALSRRRRDD
jgi:predicted RND superfamily exporter protein